MSQGGRREPEDMHRERDLTQYESTLLGLDQVMEYALKRTEKPLIVDIGTGSGKAASQLQEAHETAIIQGVDTEEHPDVRKNLGNNFFKRDAANMPELRDQSVDAFFLVHSIAYAENASELSKIAQELWRAAKKGALLKGSALTPFVTPGDGLKQTTSDIRDALESTGFIVVLASETGRSNSQLEDVFLAMKPDGNDDPEDIEYLLQQMIVE